MVYSNNFGQTRVGVRVVTQVVNAVDADATAFIAAASITDLTQAAAISTLVNDLKTYGLWTKMKAFYPMVGGTAASHKFNLKDPRDLDAAYRLTFFGGLIHDSNGVLGNGTTGYAYTNLPQNTMGLNNMSMGWYNMNNVADSTVNRYAIGSSYSGMQFRYFNLFYGNIQFISGTTNSFTNSTTQKGMYIMSRQNSTDALAYKNGVIQSTVSQTGITTSLGSRIFVLFGKDSGLGTAAAPGVNLFGSWHGNCIYFADGMNGTEVANFYTSVQKFQTTLGRQDGTPYVSDSDAQAFLNAASITDTTQSSAINTLVTDLKAAGVWTKMKAVYPFIGGTATSHKFNLKDPRDLDAAYRLVFNGGWTHTSTGAKPNGTTGYADTKIAPNAMAQNSIHVSFYSRTDYTGNVYDIGSYNVNGVTNGVAIAPKFNGNAMVYMNNSNNDNVLSNNPTTGFYLGNRTSSSISMLFRNDIKIINATKSSSTPIGLNIYLGAINDSPVVYSPREQAFASIGDGLTDLEESNFYKLVQKYQTTIGRQIDIPLVSDGDAQSFLNAAGITSYIQASAVNTLVVDLKAAGIWTKIKALYPMVGGTSTSHKWNLKDPRDTNDAYRLSFSGGWTHGSTGAKPNGTNAYADTFIVPKNVFNSTTFEHVGYYSRTNTSLTTPPYRYDLGVDNYDASGNYTGGLSMIIRRDTNVTLYASDYGTLATYRLASTTTSDSLGFFLGSQTGTNIKLYKNNSILSTNTGVSNASYNMLSNSSTRSIWIGTMNELNYTTQNRWTDKETGLISIGEGLNDSEASLLYTAVQKFNTSLGRQVGTPVYNTSGLVLNLDASNANSYPGTGTTWFDLASGNNGTLVNGPTYDTANGGGLILNGSNKYISSFNNTNLNFTSSDKFTISCFFKATSTSSYLGLVVSGNTSGEWNYGIWVTNGKLQVGTHNNNRVGNSTIVTGQIYQATLTYSNNTMKVYLNGLNDGTFTSISLFNGLNQQLSIGRKGANPEWYFPGTVYNVQIYNRELSETEVLQNFNNTRGRFGL